MDEQKRREILNTVGRAAARYTVDTLDQHTQWLSTDQPDPDAVSSVYAGLLDGILWNMAGSYGSRGALTFVLDRLSVFVEYRMPQADAQHAAIAAEEEQKAAQQAELAAAQEAEAVR